VTHDPHAEAITVRADLGGGAEGWLVVDTTVDDSSAGGLRISEDLGVEEVAALAREMTLKFAFIGRASGGAKSGLRLPAGAGPDAKRRLLTDLGRHLGPLLRRGVYYPGTDINCSGEDLRWLYRGAGLRVGDATDTARFTAMSAHHALEACRAAAGGPSRPLRLAVEGFGAVAAALVARLPREEFSVTAISTAEGAVLDERGFDPPALTEARRRHGAAMVEHLPGVRGPREAVFAAAVDLFLPSARTWSLTAERARGLRAVYVVPLANAPYGERAVAILEARGVACLPGFAVNCGGIFGSSLHDSGVPLAEVEALSRRSFQPVVAALLEARAARAVSPVTLALAVAHERLAERAAAARPRSRAWRIAGTLARERLPRGLYGRSYARRFEQNLVELAALVRRRGAEGEEGARRWM
jgi:glutamate dehydrogenase (NAD(P)+)